MNKKPVRPDPLKWVWLNHATSPRSYALALFLAEHAPDKIIRSCRRWYADTATVEEMIVSKVILCPREFYSLRAKKKFEKIFKIHNKFLKKDLTPLEYQNTTVQNETTTGQSE